MCSLIQDSPLNPLRYDSAGRKDKGGVDRGATDGSDAEIVPPANIPCLAVSQMRDRGPSRKEESTPIERDLPQAS